jgi:hypothetical protein
VKARQRVVSLLPRPLARASYWVASRRSAERRRAYRIRTTYDAAVQTVKQTTGRVVATGPFRGMRYIDLDRAPLGSPIAPSLLGSYEAELHPLLEDLISQRFPRVVNIGSAEGYYAVGMALRLPDAEVFAFEADDATRALCGEMAALNGVSERVHLEGCCVADRLDHVVAGQPTLVICDCEGCELDVLDPDAAPALAGATVLVELHDFVNPTITETIERRFGPSHDIEFIDMAERSPEPYQQWLAPLPAWIRPWIVSEFRTALPPQRWALLRPR